jgi:ammonium transporter Rh
VADFCAAAVLIAFGAVLGKATPIQLIVMATLQVVAQSINEHIGLHIFHVRMDIYSLQ